MAKLTEAQRLALQQMPHSWMASTFRQGFETQCGIYISDRTLRVLQRLALLNIVEQGDMRHASVTPAGRAALQDKG